MPLYRFSEFSPPHALAVIALVGFGSPHLASISVPSRACSSHNTHEPFFQSVHTGACILGIYRLRPDAVTPLRALD